MSMDQNNMMVNSPGGEVGFQSQPYRENYVGATQPIMDASRSSGVTPQILVLLLTSAIKRCWKWALFLGLILSPLGAGLIWQFYPTKYEATSWLFAFSQVPFIVFQTEEGRSSYDSFLATQFAMITNPLVLNEVLNDKRVLQVKQLIKQKDRAQWLRKNIIVSRQGKSEYFTISYSDSDPDDAVAVVAAVTDAYLNRVKNETIRRDTELVENLKSEKSLYENTVKMQQRVIQDRMKDAARKGAEITTNLTGGFMQQESITKDYILAEANLEAATARYEAAKAFDPTTRDLPEILLEDAIQNDPSNLSLSSQINELTAMIEARSKSVTAEDDKLRDLKARLEETKANQDELQKRLASEKQQELQNRLKLTVQQDLWAKEAEIESQKILVAKLKEKVDQQKADVEDRTEDTANITFLSAKLDRDNQVLDKLSERIVTLQTETHSPARISLASEAVRPTEPKSATKIPLTIMAGIGLIFAPFILGIALEMMRPRLYHVSQVRKAVPDILIGEIMEPPVAWLHGNAFRKRLARYRESVHNWCTHLLLADPFRRCQTLAVASVAGDDGKTFLAIQIASAMAQMKSGPVLLIDGDMRVGRLHLLFGNEESGPGLADVLSFRKGIGEAVVLNEREPNLHLLSAGNLDVSPYELLGDGRFRELLDTLSTHYSLILVVVPPVAHAAESLMMAASVDSVILCVRQGETVLAAMEDAFRKLVNTGSHVDGVVVKDIPYSHMAAKDGGFADKIEQIRLAHLLKHSDAY